MKKEIKIILFIILIIVFIIGIVVGIVSWTNKKKQEQEEMKKKEQERYEEILNKFESALNTYLDATFVIKNEYNCSVYNKKSYTSYHLINTGNLKKEDMLEADGKSYCSALAIINIDKNCNISYDTYLNCKNRKDIDNIDEVEGLNIRK